MVVGPVNRYVHRKSIFLYLDRFVVVVCGRKEGQDIEMTACLFVSVMQYSLAQGRLRMGSVQNELEIMSAFGKLRTT